jgi:mersacidin/lichenicidin family type 2 lantibiotic
MAGLVQTEEVHMSQMEVVVRAWKDEEFRASLGAQVLATLPENPAGPVELGSKEKGACSGGYNPFLTFICSTNSI